MSIYYKKLIKYIHKLPLQNFLIFLVGIYYISKNRIKKKRDEALFFKNENEILMSKIYTKINSLIKDITSSICSRYNNRT